MGKKNNKANKQNTNKKQNTNTNKSTFTNNQIDFNNENFKKLDKILDTKGRVNLRKPELRNFKGKKINTDQTPEGLLARKKTYRIDALLITLLLTIINFGCILNSPEYAYQIFNNNFLNAITHSIIIFIPVYFIAYFIEYHTDEKSVKKFIEDNQKTKK